MTEPKRWSDSGSDVDPVLRSVARYAQNLKPSDAALQRLLVAAAARPDAPVRRRSLRRASVVVAFGLAAAFGGVAWAGYSAGWFDPPRAAVVTARQKSPPASHPVLRAPAAAPLPVTSASIPSASRAVPLPPPSRPTPSAEAAQLPSDTELLQQARAVVISNPARALTLTRDHEVHHPGSALVEERQALRVEALARLGRRAEAERALDAFETGFPRSPYRRRLRALITP